MTYLHYKDNGDMVSDPAFLQATAVAKEGKYYKTGVGNYNASWEKIEAEWFFKREGNLVKRESPKGGFEIRNITNNDYLVFPQVHDLKSNATINFNLSSAAARGARIEVRLDNPHGKLLGTCRIPDTGSWNTYKTISCKLKNDASTANLCFIFKGSAQEMARLDWFNIK